MVYNIYFVEPYLKFVITFIAVTKNVPNNVFCIAHFFNEETNQRVQSK